MSTDNPYQAPSSEVIEATGGNINPPRRVPAGHAMAWISGGWEYFKKNPLAWIGAIIVYVVINTIVSFLPVISLAMNIINPVFIGGFMLGCMAEDDGHGFNFEHLFAGFKNRFGDLAIVGLLSLVGIVVVVIVVTILVIATLGATGGFSAITNPQAGSPEPEQLLFFGLLVVLVAVALMLPIAMAIWFAPALVVHGQKSAVDALKLSFAGTLRNFVPFLVYGLILLVLFVVAVIPLLLGLLVLAPVVTASVYTSYKDIYVHGG